MNGIVIVTEPNRSKGKHMRRLAAFLTLAAFAYSVYRAWPRLSRALKDLTGPSEPRMA